MPCEHFERRRCCCESIYDEDPRQKTYREYGCVSTSKVSKKRYFFAILLCVIIYTKYGEELSSNYFVTQLYEHNYTSNYYEPFVANYYKPFVTTKLYEHNYTSNYYEPFLETCDKLYRHNYSSNFTSEDIKSDLASKIGALIFMAAIIAYCLTILFPQKNQKFIGTRVGNMYLGDTVSIHGLNRGECYNDMACYYHIATTGRYVVRLKKDFIRLKKDFTYISVKPQNLEVVY